MRIDAHQHFWSYSPQEYPWIQSDWPIRRDFLPQDLAPLLQRCGLDGCVAVQARQSCEETRWLLELADSNPFIKGVVGWVDLRASHVQGQLTSFALHSKFRGVRHVVQDEPDERFMLRADFQRGIRALRKFGLTYDLLVFPKQLPAAIGLARAFPEQPFVLDHIAKPSIREGLLSPWREQILELAKYPNVFCKLSGMVTEARWNQWKTADFVPFMDVIFQAFGPDRLMFGSDWPVALLSADYEEVHSLAKDYIQRHGSAVETKVFGVNAVKFYNL